ncbi:hypothetical protein F5146DRAFT_1138336 [Armillaria mellea]|nr:hypothetical protein F5146DRAFT_1138336 [Armillaria mellea]
MPKSFVTNETLLTSTVRDVPELFIQEPLIPNKGISMLPSDLDDEPLTSTYVPVSIDGVPVSTDGPAAGPDHHQAQEHKKSFLVSFIHEAEEFSKNAKSSEASSTIKAYDNPVTPPNLPSGQDSSRQRNPYHTFDSSEEFSSHRKETPHNTTCGPSNVIQTPTSENSDWNPHPDTAAEEHKQILQIILQDPEHDDLVTVQLTLTTPSLDHNTP